jgi:DNA-binding XRE family transcriptional regulator
MTGPALRRLRLRADLKVTDVARTMGLSRATIHTIERSAEVSEARTAEYRTAVQTLKGTE